MKSTEEQINLGRTPLPLRRRLQIPIWPGSSQLAGSTRRTVLLEVGPQTAGISITWGLGCWFTAYPDLPNQNLHFIRLHVMPWKCEKHWFKAAVINVGSEARHIWVQTQCYCDPMACAFWEASLSFSFVPCGMGIMLVLFLRGPCKNQRRQCRYRAWY